MSLGGGKGAEPKSTVADRIGSLRIQSQGYGNVLPWVAGKNRIPVTLFHYTNFIAFPITTSPASSGGKGMGKKKQPTNTTFIYSAAIMLGLTGHEIIGTGKLWIDKKVYADIYGAGFDFFENLPITPWWIAAHALAGFTLFTGSASQSPWGFMASYEPAKAVNLRNFSYLAANNYPLGDNASMGNHTVEIKGIGSQGTYGDAKPDVFIPLFLTDQCGFPAAKIGSMTTYAAWCAANDFILSPALTEQVAGQQVLSEWLQITNSTVIWSEGLLKFIPHDSTAAPVYALTHNDFVAQDDEVPVRYIRKKTQDSYNHIRVEFLNRVNDYNIEIAEAKDQANIEAFGLRTMESVKCHAICHQHIARNVAEHIKQRSLYIRNTYEFNLSIRYILLEPMDVITITDAAMGINALTVRIIKIVITADFLLNITAEEYVPSVLLPVIYPPAAAINNYRPDYSAVPSNINPPIIFSAPASLTASGYEIWCGISSSDPLFGGCQIHVSFDGGSSYVLIGNHMGETRMGVLTANLPSATDPDSTNTLSVDMSVSAGELYSVSQQSVDFYETLCKVNQEFLAYRDVTLTGPSQYDLDYLRRGLFSSVKGANVGDSLVRCDDSLFKYAYNPVYQNTIVMLKFVAYNIYNDGLQDISTVPAYSFVPSGVYWDSGAATWDTGSTTWSA